MTGTFPFQSVVGQAQAKLALQLVAVDPLIGGVLLRGEKGSAKTTLARGLAALLGGAPFVDLPLGATEDRLIGTLDIGAALGSGELRFRPGLLAAADRGVLYVDEVNLLADHLVDTLLDVAVSGVNRVERDGVAHEHDSRFVLVGSMNPEEGELRPQLLDRFGLCVDVRASTEIEDRTEIVRRRLAFDRGSFASSEDPAVRPGSDLTGLAPAEIGDELIEKASRLALAVGVEGLRADLVLCRAAAANAALDGRAVATTDDLGVVAPLVLAHRSRRSPFDPPVLSTDQIQQALRDALEPPPPDEPPAAEGPNDDPDPDPDPDTGSTPAHGASRPLMMGSARRPPATPQPAKVEGARGHLVGDLPFAERPGSPIAVAGTIRHAAQRSAGAAVVEPGDLRTAVRALPTGTLVILVVDTSGSMGAPERARAATGAVLGLLTDAYQRRDQVAMITFGGDGATVVLPPTGSVEVARRRLESLDTGGQTPLAAGLVAGLNLATSASVRRDAERVPRVVVLSDGRATGGRDALQAATEAARRIQLAGVSALVLDCESGSPRLGLARPLAEAMGADYAVADDLSPTTLRQQLRDHRDR